MDLPQLEQEFTHRFGWAITLALVAGSAFLIGQSYQLKDQPKTVSDPQNTPANVSPTIQEIQQALSAGEKTESSPDTTVPTSGLIKLNSATLAELESLPRIDPAKAQAIIDYRTQNGMFVRIDDLLNVGGIGPKTLEQMRSQLTL